MSEIPFIPYGRQSLGEEEVEAVAEVLRSDFLTQGPVVERFEKTVADFCGVKHAIAVSSGTAALHAAYAAFGIGAGDEVLTSPITFAASANAALYLGAKPVFADVDPDSGLIDPRVAASKISDKTRALVAIDYAGRPADYDALRVLANAAEIPLIADAAHSLGAEYHGKKVGQLADASILSFHPVKTITTGEGGMILTDRDDVAERARRFRHHGIQRTPELFAREGAWHYELTELGNNYRLSDVHAAIGFAQMKKLDSFVSRRREIARRYDEAFAEHPAFGAPLAENGFRSARHLYVLRLKESFASKRRVLFDALRKRAIGVQVHYMPTYLHPLYRELGYPAGLCPEAERFYAGAISIPIYPSLSDGQVERVIACVREACREVFATSAARTSGKK